MNQDMAMRAVIFIMYQLLLFEQMVSFTFSDYAVNVALGKPTNQSTTYTGLSKNGDTPNFLYSASLAVDGNKNTNFNEDSCSSTDANQNDPWWTLDLQGLFFVTRLNIYQRAGQLSDRNIGSTLWGIQNNGTYIHLMTFSSTDRGDIKTNLSMPVTIKGIKIEHKGTNVFVSLCEVEVFAEVNVAKGKQASQSSTYNGDANYGDIGPYNASLAVDGNTDTIFHGNSCSHTDPRFTSAFWKVDLQDLYSVIGIRIFQRSDSGNDATLNGFQIFGIRADRSNEQIRTPTPYRTGVINMDISPSKIFKGIMLQLNHTNTKEAAIITICELQVFADITCQSSPSIPGNSRLLQTNIKKQWPYINDFTLVCDQGYSLVGPSSLRCGGLGTWNGSFEHCTVVRCIDPIGELKNGVIAYQSGIKGNLTYNSTVSIRCQEGYNLTGGVDHVHCVAQNAWDGTLGICSVVKCVDKMLQRNNSFHVYYPGIKGNLTYNSTVLIGCQEGYNLIGTDRVHCTADSQWDGSLGNCSVVKCVDKMLQRNNSFRVYYPGIKGNLTYNSIVSIRCQEGYNLIGTDRVHCTADSQWDGNLGNCSVARCVDESLQRNNSVLLYKSGIEGNLTYNASVYIRCQVGYNLNGKDLARCNALSRWDGTLGTCSVARCVDESIKRNNSVLVYQSGIEGNLTYNATVSIRCQVGYTLTGTDRATCNARSRWDGTLGNCSVAQCVDESLQRNNSVNVYQSGIEGNLTYNATVSIGCQVGYTLTGKNLVRCNAYSRWDGTLGNCSVVRCVDESLQRNNSVLVYQSGIEGNLTYNATVSISCQVRYNLAGTDLVRCNAHGHWDGTLGDCSKSARDGEPESSVAGIAGGVTATIVAVILGVTIAYLLYRRRARGPNDKMADTTLNTIPSSSKRKGHNEEVILDTSIYAQPNKMNLSPKRPEMDETKTEYMNSNDRSRDYYSFTSQNVTDKHSIRVDDLSSFFLSRKMEPVLYEEEYKKLPNGLTKSHDVALLPENKSKNRYKNMYPYDDTRVRLEIWDPNNENDYINACYIKGFNTDSAYIAAQGPTKGILNDFWRMIWQTKCSKIVMLTNLIEEGKHKCEQYWPDEGSVEYGDIVIRLVQCETFSDFTIRTLDLRKTGERREDKNKGFQVKQFHFTAWPDRGVPRFASSLVHFRHKIHTTKTRQNLEGPIVVHCSAGIGRTGTFLALDYLVDQAEKMGYINVVHCVENLRKQRVNLVQTLEQYIFVHEALVEALTCTTIAMSTSEFQENYRKLLERDTKTGKRKLDDAFELLPMYVSDPGEDVYVNAKDIENRDKNRYSNILPDKNHCPYLNVYVKGRDAYINAVFLPAYKLNDIFVVTQTPLENTIVDFWRMVYQLEVSTIVMLNTLSEMKEEERYWTENEETLEIAPFRITLESKTSDDICTNYTMLLKYHDERRRVRLSRATYWAYKKNVPNSPTAMLKQIDLIQRWQQETCNKPIVVHCMNGAERSGLFCIVAALLERTKIEQDVAVEQIIKQMRSRRPQVIPNVDQFKFCYDAVSAYLDQFDTYSNFAGL